jgi:hypothetical protein
VRLRLAAVLIGLAILPAGVGVAYALSGSTRSASKTVESKHDDAAKNTRSHGAAVSAAAHCRLKGAAHGALVRSVAANKSATPAGSRSACLAAGGQPKIGPGNSTHDKAHEPRGDRPEAH